MRDITNDALRKLYFACEHRSGFPGNMPATMDSNENDISVHAILQGLGLIKASSEDVFSRDNKDPFRNVERPVREVQHRSQCSPLTSASAPPRPRSSSSYTDTSSLIRPHHVTPHYLIRITCPSLTILTRLTVSRVLNFLSSTSGNCS
jgi:hypothetical protein